MKIKREYLKKKKLLKRDIEVYKRAMLIFVCRSGKKNLIYDFCQRQILKSESEIKILNREYKMKKKK